MDLKSKKIPRHVGVIMDGNGRWAQRRVLPRNQGHRAGVKRMEKMVEYAKKLGVEFLTVYALSTENLSRPQSELDGLYNLLRTYFKDGNRFKDINIKIIGDISPLPKDVQEYLKKAQVCSPEFKFTLVFAINYGGRAEILRAVNCAIENGKHVSEEEFSSLLYTDGIPEPDLIIRTGKEKRLSNFLIWQAAYSELYFTDVLFPDFTEKEFDKAIADFSKRERRFGKVKEIK